MRAQVDAFDQGGRPVPVCQLLWPTTKRSEEETWANGYLIAASPKLLAALKRLLAVVEPDDTAPWDAGTEVSQARAAIAEAEGRI
jgi:hypothetical protein